MQVQERERLRALSEYRLADVAADPGLRAVVRLAATLAGVPCAALNLVDGSSQHMAVTVGLQGGEDGLDDALCGVRLAERTVVHVPDASLDPAYAASPFVTGERATARLYASAPLVTPRGDLVGTLCVADPAPGRLSAAQLAGLEDLAGVAVGLLERRRLERRAEVLEADAQEQQLLFEYAVRELELRQEFTDAVLDTVDVGVAACDPRGRLTLFNRAARHLHGLDADPSVEPSAHAEHYALFAPDGATVLKPEQVPLHRALHEGRIAGAELVVAPAGRAPTSVVASGRALRRDDGTLLGAVVALTDVTAERAHRAAVEAASAQLARRTAELERSNRDLEQFAAVAGHDLASPLSVVGGYVEMVSELHGGALDEQARQWLGTALQGVERMKGLIGALLGYARAGGTTCRRDLVDAREVLDHVVVDLRTAVVEASARVVAPGGLPVLHCDPVLLRQLLQNLVGNALKYRSPERTCRVVVTATAVEEGWELAVADNGIGIPPERREEVFGMFAVLGGHERTGHGIGLATCQRIVERHGGRIWVDPSPAVGTTVRFTLPQRRALRD